MGSRVAEINQHAIAHVFGDEAVEPGDGLGDGAVISGNDLAQILGIEARGERRRADEIAEHDCQLPALGGEGCWPGCRTIHAAQRGDCLEQFSTMTDRGYAEADQIIDCQARQHLGVNVVIVECLHVTFEPEAVQPTSNVHRCFLRRADRPSGEA